MKEILIAGGAGYIGSHMCKYLAQHNMRPVVVDNLSSGHREAVQWGPFYEGDIADADLLKKVFAQHNIEAVMHFAAFCYVGESVEKPLKYYQNNIAATLTLLSEMLAHDVFKFIFSSTCATYGEPATLPILEDFPQQPINPYGRSKQMMEQILDDLDRGQQMKAVCLRYFNAAGADPEGQIGEDHRPETHLIPLVLQTALGQREEITIFGDDYPTDDGTCVRDYIHVVDLAQAHYLSLLHLLDGGQSRKYNLGNGNGYSILEVIDATRSVTGAAIPLRYGERRPGDPAALVGSSALITEELNWQPQHHRLEEIIQTAWRWHKENPDGFKED
ncbi:MAG: UDP-glucose 4-epimerase GalE [Deltaproteobacteria bacterium]|nr:MAG: UDP-glucose 4-epimerase GalE [Deltaproteobacteria bacterium]